MHLNLLTVRLKELCFLLYLEFFNVQLGRVCYDDAPVLNLIELGCDKNMNNYIDERAVYFV